jgi:hypothetical protein
MIKGWRSMWSRSLRQSREGVEGGHSAGATLRSQKIIEVVHRLLFVERVLNRSCVLFSNQDRRDSKTSLHHRIPVNRPLKIEHSTVQSSRRTASEVSRETTLWTY